MIQRTKESPLYLQVEREKERNKNNRVGKGELKRKLMENNQLLML